MVNLRILFIGLDRDRSFKDKNLQEQPQKCCRVKNILKSLNFDNSIHLRQINTQTYYTTNHNESSVSN